MKAKVTPIKAMFMRLLVHLLKRDPVKVAKMFNISRATIYRHLKK
tara:strand:- start:848 stop:982 length:135 start_codon:yes stop_codon:yes gene_type:complete